MIDLPLRSPGGGPGYRRGPGHDPFGMKIFHKTERTVVSGPRVGSVTMPGRTVRLTGWGRVSPSSAELASPGSAAAAAEVLARATAGRGVIPRGLGRSYNNAAQCDGGVVISTARLNRIVD